LTPEKGKLLEDLVGNNLQALATEIEKLALLAEERGRPPTVEEIVEVVMDQADLAVFAINKHLGPGETSQALKTWFHLANWGSDAYSLMPLMLFRVRTAALAEALSSEGLDHQSILKRAGFNAWLYNNETKPLVAKLGRDGVRRALVAGRRCDAALKSSPLDSGLALERFLMEVCIPSEEAPRTRR
jgi:DNA polymerase III delta subunit